MNDTLTRGVRHITGWWSGVARKMSGHLSVLYADDDMPSAPAVNVMRSNPPLTQGTVLDDSFRQLAFTFAVIALGAKLAAADGDIRQEEFTAFCALFPMPDEEQPKIQRLFFLAHSDPNSFNHYARQLAALFPSQYSLRAELMKRLCRLAEADGRATLSEKRMLEAIALALKVEKGIIYETLAPSLSSIHVADPYGLIGVLQSVSNEEIKRAYRDRIRELHPDRMAGEGYASEDIQHAEAELRAVNEAYLIISRKRKIK